MKLYEAYSNLKVAEARFTFYFGDNITVHLHFCVKTGRQKKIQTLTLEAKLMIDRWRSLFLCAGVNSGREAALSTAAGT